MSRGTFFVLALLLPVSAWAQPQTPTPLPHQEQRALAPVTADVLIAALQHTDEVTARRIEDQLDLVWSKSGSASADLLLRRAEDAADDGDYDTASAILVRLTAAEPNFAEGWHQRAEIAAERQDFHDAMVSLQRALVLNPRHFGALSELGVILEEFGDKAHALAAYRKALALDPYLEDVPERISALAREVEGQGI
jgi:Flp pilus assembly protein TadD